MPFRPQQPSNASGLFDPGQKVPPIGYGTWGDHTTGPGLVGSSGKGVVPTGDGQMQSGAGVLGVNAAWHGIGVHGVGRQGTGVSGTGVDAGVRGDATAGPGVTGASVQGPGVNGSSTQGAGVPGGSTGGPDVAGRSALGSGVSATSTQGSGVAGTSGSGPGDSGTNTCGAGMAGTSTSGTGALGTSTRGPGVSGISASGPEGSGSTTSGPGAAGTAVPGPGVAEKSTLGTGVSAEGGAVCQIDDPLTPVDTVLTMTYVGSNDRFPGTGPVHQQARLREHTFGLSGGAPARRSAGRSRPGGPTTGRRPPRSPGRRPSPLNSVASTSTDPFDESPKRGIPSRRSPPDVVAEEES